MLEVELSDTFTLDAAVAFVEQKWRDDPWSVRSERQGYGPIRMVDADDDGFDLKVRYYEIAAGNQVPEMRPGYRLLIFATTPCAKPG